MKFIRKWLLRRAISKHQKLIQEGKNQLYQVSASLDAVRHFERRAPVVERAMYRFDMIEFRVNTLIREQNEMINQLEKLSQS